MDIILLQDVKRLGGEGSVVRVKPGFARNFLFPRQLAVPATDAQRRMVERCREERQLRADKIKSKLKVLRRKIEGLSVTLKLKLGEDDKPFGSITSHDIAEALEREGLKVDKRAIELDKPIKTLGIYDIPVKLHTEVTATLKVWVVKD